MLLDLAARGIDRQAADGQRAVARASEAMSMSSRLPPPRSPAIPSGSVKPIMMPWATSLASFSPESTSMRVPQAFSARAINSAPSTARARQPCKARTFFTRMRAMAEANQRGSAIAASPPAAVAMERPRPPPSLKPRGARTAPSDDETHGIRADVDDADGLELQNTALLAEQPLQARHVSP
jgi:hypothetical protein